MRKVDAAASAPSTLLPPAGLGRLRWVVGGSPLCRTRVDCVSRVASIASVANIAGVPSVPSIAGVASIPVISIAAISRSKLRGSK